MGGFWNDFFERLDLGGFWNDFFEIFGQNAKKAKNAKKRKKPAKQELNHKWPDCQGWVGGGAPPRGVSIRRPPKVCEACGITSPIAF